MRATGVRGAGVVVIAALSGLAGLAPGAGTADAATTKHQWYTITIKATTTRWEESHLPGGFTTGTWFHASKWTARGTTLVTRTGARVRFSARIGGTLTSHRGFGNAFVKINDCEDWSHTVDLAPGTKGAFRGTLQYYAFPRRTGSGKRVNVVSLLFGRRAPLMDPPLDEAWAATRCSPPAVIPGRTTLAVPPTWVLRRPLAGKRALPRFRFGRAFTWKGILPDDMPVKFDVPGGSQKTTTRWTITFKPMRRR